jgi:RHS repeat-associated protein
VRCSFAINLHTQHALLQLLTHVHPPVQVDQCRQSPLLDLTAGQITDASQNVVQSYSYDPYGKVLGATRSLANAFQYVGAHGVMADEDGLYHMQVRYYDPEARRFITEDPLGVSVGLNLYGYTGGEPGQPYRPLRPARRMGKQPLGIWKWPMGIDP